MAKAGLSQVYNLYANTYDATFGRVLGYRLGHAIRKLSLRPGMKILDVGVGTGLTLKYYPRYVDVVGIDLSEGMLSMAEKRIRELQLKNARVMLGNAQQMPFGDGEFDVIFMGHVLSVVDDPVAVLKEAFRVGKPGATIMVVNFLQSRWGPIARVEKKLSPLFMKLGWRTDLSLVDLLVYEGIGLVKQERMFRGDPFGIITFKSLKPKPITTEVREGDKKRISFRVI
jgi:phosphatidylethanolamine/phosphatidyl-N-methylethanolamine N-methyltransferase